MRLMHLVACFTLLVGVVTSLPSTASAQTKDKWVCTAEKLKSYRYDGGKTAMIHLKPYSKGGKYAVTSITSTKVTGKTKDGRVFVCEKQVSA